MNKLPNFILPIYLKGYNLSDNYLLFNTINQTLIELSPIEYKNLNSSYSSSIKLQLFKDLEKEGLFDIFDLPEEKGNRIVIIPTLQCNKHCEYCYHLGSQKIKLDKKEIPLILSFIFEFLDINKTDKLTLIWHGGEPLMAYDLIHIINEQVQVYCKSKNISFYSSLLTNGLLLKNHVENLNNITELQISIDDNTTDREFLDICQSIPKLLLTNISIFVKYNITTFNTQRINKIIDKLSSLAYNDKLFFRLGYLEPHGNNNTTPKYFSYLSFIDFYWSLANILRDYNLGWPPELPNRIYSTCVANDRNSITIGPDLFTYRCNVNVPESNWRIYNIKNQQNLNNKNSSDTFLNYDPFKDICKNCRVVYNCMGGCHVKRLFNQRSKDFCLGTIERIKLQVIDYYKNETNSKNN